jgi:N-acetylmuramoyl-L-alanine amidase
MRWINSSGRVAVAIAILLSVEPVVGAAAQRSARTLYQDAQDAEARLHRSDTRLGKRSEWIKVANAYRKVVLQHPQSGYCDDALYYEGQLYIEVYRRFDDREALRRALDAHLLLANGYPSSKWARSARLVRGKLFLEELSDRKAASIELRKITSTWPNTAEAAEAHRLIENMKAPSRRSVERFPRGVVGVRNIRHWTGREYTRIVIDLDAEVKFRQGQLENPDRIYFDLLGTRVAEDLASRSFPIEDGFLRRIRVGQNKPDVVRVVFDFANISEYKFFILPDPYRLVVDIMGKKPEHEALTAQKKNPEPAPEATPSSSSAQEPPDVEETQVSTLKVAPEPRRDGYSLVQQLGLDVGRIVIDPGHGGHDPGTMSKSLQEKDIVLDIARRVAKILEERNFDVLLTRNKDVFIPLEERTAIANSKGADLFVSIHVNASRSSRPRGTETYYLNLATTPDAEEVAARENAVNTRRLGELQNLLQQVMNNSKITESRELARHVQSSMADDLFRSKKDPRNRGVKTAPFYVLLGAQIPSVLVEVAYLSNRKDEQLLADASYRQKIAESIAEGIRGYHSTLVQTTRVSIPASVMAGSGAPP